MYEFQRGIAIMKRSFDGASSGIENNGEEQGDVSNLTFEDIRSMDVMVKIADSSSTKQITNIFYVCFFIGGIDAVLEHRRLDPLNLVVESIVEPEFG